MNFQHYKGIHNDEMEIEAGMEKTNKQKGMATLFEACTRKKITWFRFR